MIPSPTPITYGLATKHFAHDDDSRKTDDISCPRLDLTVDQKVTNDRGALTISQVYGFTSSKKSKFLISLANFTTCQADVQCTRSVYLRSCSVNRCLAEG